MFIKYLLLILLNFTFQINSQLFKVKLTRERSIFERDEQKAQELIDIFTKRGTGTLSFNLTRFPISSYLSNRFYGEILVGKPQRRFKVLLDTGTSNLWLASTLCVASNCICVTKTLYNRQKSSTWEEDGRLFDIDYGSTGRVKGYFSKENVWFGGWPIFNLTFGEAAQVFGPFFFDTQFDGVFGLGLEKLSEHNVKTPLHTLYIQTPRNFAKHPAFSFYFNRRDDKGFPDDGEFAFGDVDNSKHRGRMVYLPVLDSGYWKLIFHSIGIGNTVFCHKCDVILNTGFKFMSGPISAITLLNKHIDAEEVGDVHVVNCTNLSKLPNIEVAITDDRKFTLRPEDYTEKIFKFGENICVSGFVSTNPIPNYDGWTLGILFIKNFYTLFDLGTNSIGFDDPV